MNEPLEEVARRARTTLSELLARMGFEAKVESFVHAEDEVLLHIESPDAAQLIGKNAQTLDALQWVMNRMLFHSHEPHAYCVVDVERYRERRKDNLLREALEAAERAIQTGQPVRLPPMGAAERRVVHQALKDNPRVQTQSEIVGHGEQKQVVIVPADKGGEGSGQQGSASL